LHLRLDRLCQQSDGAEAAARTPGLTWGLSIAGDNDHPTSRDNTGDDLTCFTGRNSYPATER
jgi:hypothetical protein